MNSGVVLDAINSNKGSLNKDSQFNWQAQILTFYSNDSVN